MTAKERRVVGHDDGMPVRGGAHGHGWPTILYRARVRDVIVASIVSLFATAGLVSVPVSFVLWGPGAAVFPTIFAVVWSFIATLLWLNARQRVLLTSDTLVIQRRVRRREIPYASITELSLDLVRGVTLRTAEGRWLILPWPPLRTASGAGMSRAREVHEELGRRVKAAAAADDTVAP